MTTKKYAFEEGWQAVLNGDRTAYNRLVEPHLEELVRAARHDIRYHQYLGDLEPGDLTPEELIGEALLRAWHSRRQRPEEASLRAWLLGTKHRVLQRLIEQEHRERALWVVSLEDPVPPAPLFDDDESFWEWYQPDDVTRWEDVLPAMPSAGEMPAATEEATQRLEPEPRQVLLLHDEHELSLAEVALVTGKTMREMAEMLGQARRVVHEAFS